jgi:hypothetical protein
MKTAASVVREVLGGHLHREAATIDLSLHLQRDLHLRPLELALVSIDLEELGGVSLSCQKIATIHTVGELVAIFTSAVAAARRSKHADVIARYFAQTSED